MTRARIDHLIAHLRLGAGRYVADTALEQACRMQQHVSVLVSPDAEGKWATDPALVAELADAAIEVVTIGDFFRRDPKTLSLTAAGLRSRWAGRPGEFVVHAHTAMGAAVARWAGAPVVVGTCHGFDPRRQKEYDLQDALAFTLCDAVTTPSRWWADKLAGMAVPRPTVIPVGLDLRKYPPVERPSRDHTQPLRIVVAAELTHRKGIDLLIEAMPRVWAHFRDAELHIMGHGDAAAGLRQQAANIDIDKDGHRILFHGYITDYYRLLPDYDLFVLPSRSDNLPVSIIEAMLARIPVIATAVGGIPELIQGSRFGALAEPESSESLAASILTLANSGRRPLEQIGIEAEAFARKRFDVRSTVADLEALYETARRNRADRSGMQ